MQFEQSNLQQQTKKRNRQRAASKQKHKIEKFKCKTKFLLFHHDQFNFISVFRLWAEVFHVSASGTGTVKWQQVSEDLVPVNITCIQDSPECVFHITAYNSQVDKILDVRLIQPGTYKRIPFISKLIPNAERANIEIEYLHILSIGTRIGQASECFVYWKDPMTNDTWGLNFTSPIDAKQFRECCVSLSNVMYYFDVCHIFLYFHFFHFVFCILYLGRKAFYYLIGYIREYG